MLHTICLTLRTAARQRTQATGESRSKPENRAGTFLFVHIASGRKNAVFTVRSAMASPAVTDYFDSSRSHIRMVKPHDPNHDAFPASRDSAGLERQDLALEQRCKDHISSLRLSAEEELSDDESLAGVDWLKEVQTTI